MFIIVIFLRRLQGYAPFFDIGFALSLRRFRG